MTNKVYMGSFHCSLYHDYLLWIIWKLNWSPTVHYEDCNFHNCHSCTCYFRLPPDWIRQHPFKWGSVMEDCVL